MNTVIPLDALNQHIAILGKTGSGKTFAAKGVVENLLRDERQVCIIDPTGAWWGLRLAANGKAKGFDCVLIGGDHADIPLVERSGAAVARLVTEQRANVVIDTSGLTVGERCRWFIDFAGTLYSTNRNPLHLVIDEAHEFMPQGKVPDPDTGKMLHAGNRLMSGGRSRGIRGILITQRPQKLHKDSLTCADTLVSLRVLSPQDRKAVKEWIDGCGDAEKGKTVLDSLAGLARGEGWVWYPEGQYLRRLRFPAISTFDSSATPNFGDRDGPKIADIDLDAVRNAMAEAVREAEANDPKLLRRRIAELEKAAKTGTKPVEVVKTVERPVLKEGQLERVQKLIDSFSNFANKVNGSLAELQRTIAPAVIKPLASIEQVKKRFELGEIKPVELRGAMSARKPTTNGATRSLADSDRLPDGERKVLTAIAQQPDGATLEQVSILAAYKKSSRNAYLQRLRSRGFIANTGSGGRMEATPAGVAALGDDFEPLPTGPELRSYWLSRLPDGEKRVLLVVLDAYPEEIARESIDGPTGYKASSRNAYLQRLTARQLIETCRHGAVRASAQLF